MNSGGRQRLIAPAMSNRIASVLALALCFSGGICGAAGDWSDKQFADWTEADALALLSSSPWVKSVQVPLPPELTPQQRRDGGAAGGGKGSGLSALEGDLLHGIREKPGVQFAKGSPRVETLEIRWESALPVRVAELKARDLSAPNWEGEYYAISVRNVHALGANFPKPAVLQRLSSLGGGNNTKILPARVAVLPQGSGKFTVLYLFSRAIQFPATCTEVFFSARIGSIDLNEKFDLTRMRHLGKLDL